MAPRPPLIVVVGSTGAGKSALAVRLARRFNGELISADSRQVYRGMNVATNKLKPPRGVRQWLVDVTSPDHPYTVQQYQRAAFRAIRDIQRRGRLPILVGGTMQYVDAVAENWRIPAVRPNQRLRAILERDLAAEGLPALVRRLRRLSSRIVRRVDTKNPRRVIRAFEVALTAWESPASRPRTGAPLFRVFKIGLAVPREALVQRLRRRAAAMLRDGLLSETRRLLAQYSPELPAMSGIGYAEAAAHLNGEITRTELIDRISTRSLQYARRQMTWWKRDPDIHWVAQHREASELARHWLARAPSGGSKND
jgi:tRNA dimethylallyltransferase